MRAKWFAFAIAILLSPSCPAFASSFSQLIVFGDSLSDNGNAYLGTGGVVPGANYGDYFVPGTVVTTKYFSDGPNTTPVGAGPQGLWIDQLATRLGVSDPIPFLLGGTDYAVGGAKTAIGIQSLRNQVGVFTGLHPAGVPSNALYAFWGGANDLLFGGDPPTKAADNIERYISTLSADGAKNFVWLNLPLLGNVPDGQSNKAALNAASVAFDTEWAADIAALQGDHIHVVGINIESLFTNLLGDPAKYGFTNVTTPAQGLPIPTDAGYLFWDGLHPTTAGHTLIADTVLNDLTAVPEPASIALFIFGLLMVCGARLKLQR